MERYPTKFNDAWLLKPKVHNDARGFFMESYNQETLSKLGLNFNFVQDNHSLSMEKGVLRGLHYQLNPMAQTKLIRVLSGEIFDVIVDIRKNSKTFGEWQSFVLNAEDKMQLLIPKGFAHGFCTLMPKTEIIYKVDQYYGVEEDCGIIWNDPILNIKWPISEPILSDKDKNLKPFLNSLNNF
ncbi:dTDP-4-dehydrorhamnose 3,5-epimerase [Bacillus sp. TS-2]|nr:dTDP-4-dehydrorhamnose 3,5-epimerase [Bacillus sp. TS-2]